MIYQILRIAVDLSRQMLFLETYYQSLEQQREYYHVNKNVDPASRGHFMTCCIIRTDSWLEGGDDKINYFKCYSQSVNMVEFLKVNIACSFAILA